MSKDTADTIRVILEIGPVAMLTGEAQPLQRKVAAVTSDCPFSSYKEILWQVERMYEELKKDRNA